jgi:hypothetical protein
LCDAKFMQNFSRTFTNLEEFSCFVSSPRVLRLLIGQFSNLPNIEVKTTTAELHSNIVNVQNQYWKMLKNKFHLTDDEVHFDQYGQNRLRIYIDRNTN